MRTGRILVTGGTGFVGRALVTALESEGRDVTLAVRRSAPRSGSRPAVEIGTIGPATEWGRALEGAGAVVHLAAHVHVAPERAAGEAATFDAVNHLGTVRLFREAARRGIPLFVFVSSITVLGSGTQPGNSFDDESAPAPETAYARSKLDAEIALAREAAGTGTMLVVLRPPLICGPGVGGNLGGLARLAASPWPVPLGGIRNERTLLSIDNLVSALRTVLTRPVAGRFVLGDRTPLSTTDIVRHLRRGAGRSAPILPIPAGLIGRAAGLVGRGGIAARLFGDLAVNADAFRRAYGWQDAVTTGASLAATGAAARAGPGALRHVASGRMW